MAFIHGPYFYMANSKKMKCFRSSYIEVLTTCECYFTTFNKIVEKIHEVKKESENSKFVQKCPQPEKSGPFRGRNITFNYLKLNLCTF